MKTQEAPLSSPQALFERLSTAQGALTLTQEAVRDATLSATLTQTLRAWLEGRLSAPKDDQEPLVEPQEPLALRLALTLHLSRSLCLRPLAPLLTQALKSDLFVGPNPLFERREARAPKGDGVSAFAQAVDYHASPTLALTAFELLLWLTPSAHPRRGELLTWARGALHAHPELLTPLWEAWPAEQEHVWLGEHLLTLLSEAPRRGEALATRLALLRREEALPLCEALAPQLKGLNAQERERVVTPLREALHKQLMRVGQVRLWVACRALLS